MTLSNSSIVFVRLEEIERFFFFWSVIFPDWPFSVLYCIKRAKFEMLLNLSVLLITRLTFYTIFNQRKGRRKCVLWSVLPFPFSITLYAQQYMCVYNLKFWNLQFLFAS
jgi:hypothetical protein